MSAILVLIIIITILQVIVCHFSLWWIIALICRFVFGLRMIGATFKVKSLAIGEGVAFAAMVLFNMLFNKESMPWLRIGLYLLFTLIVVGLEVLDGVLYIYNIEDDEEE